MKILKLVVGSALILTCSRAIAESDSNGTGLFLEPGLSYQVTNSNLDYGTSGTNSSAATSGFGVLLRGGVHVFDRFFVAADARYALLKFNDNTSNLSVNASSWDIAPVVGLQMPESGPRVYVGYVLAGTLNPQSANNVDLNFEQAVGWRAGVGLKIHFVSVNIEWQRLHYGYIKVTNGPASSTSGLSYNPEGLMASVTFPIEFN